MYLRALSKPNINRKLWLVTEYSNGKRGSTSKMKLLNIVTCTVNILPVPVCDQNVHSVLTCATFYQRFIIRPVLYNCWCVYGPSHSHSRGVPLPRSSERDARCCIKFRSYSVMFCPIASDLCVFRFFVINGLPGESIWSATRKCFTLYLNEILSHETI